jgi:hypothetical protein
MAAETVWAAANEVPPEWYGGDLSEMEALVEKLLARRSRIRELIEAFGNSDRKPFPKWGGRGEKGGRGLEGGRMGDYMREGELRGRAVFSFQLSGTIREQGGNRDQPGEQGTGKENRAFLKAGNRETEQGSGELDFFC